MSDRYASKKVMQHYLTALLTDDDVPQQLTRQEPDVKQKLESLLAKVTTTKVAAEPAIVRKAALVPVEPKETKPAVAPKLDTAELQQAVVSRKSQPGFTAEQVLTEKSYRQGDFQALFFSVAGLTVALPLKELGGIHKLTSINTMPGNPAWFKGVMLQREQKINVVDTGLWVMPEKFTLEQAESHQYQYVIMLSNSAWGLACDKLINTVTLSQDDVKWREAAGKRPWLAGLIKQHMCALLDVDALVGLLQQGQGR
ncbi:chemotaxis protein CheW [Alkalimonas mucilaginosa]|uniref:Chemotaxis protein CheW n=1 Tax=Alkalimonas mucilaginosa TaxID=3057676 RepID=A0ABU7JHD1_9GAMM|nr:chemotaxis protein CheW [Alkalimonas sp. MEB004]MEE2025092.1 chemotaxis protein CheW [Alkalimonas sp. MEB004]